MLKQDFTDDFLYLVEKIFANKENTVFTRLNEGEYWLLIGNNFVGAGGLWRTRPNSRLQKDLLNSLDVVDDSFVYGIASLQHPVANQWYKENIKGQKTLATLFVNANWKHFKEIITNIKEEVVLVANEKGKDNEYPFKVKNYFWVPFDCVKYYEENEKEINKLVNRLTRYKNRLILFSAWPLANILIYKCWKKNPNNRYIDVGSTLDPRIHWEPSRQYFFTNSKTARQKDIF